MERYAGGGGPPRPRAGTVGFGRVAGFSEWRLAIGEEASYKRQVRGIAGQRPRNPLHDVFGFVVDGKLLSGPGGSPNCRTMLSEAGEVILGKTGGSRGRAALVFGPGVPPRTRPRGLFDRQPARVAAVCVQCCWCLPNPRASGASEDAFAVEVVMQPGRCATVPSRNVPSAREYLATAVMASLGGSTE